MFTVSTTKKRTTSYGGENGTRLNPGRFITSLNRWHYYGDPSIRIRLGCIESRTCSSSTQGSSSSTPSTTNSRSSVVLMYDGVSGMDIDTTLYHLVTSGPISCSTRPDPRDGTASPQTQ